MSLFSHLKPKIQFLTNLILNLYPHSAILASADPGTPHGDLRAFALLVFFFFGLDDSSFRFLLDWLGFNRQVSSTQNEQTFCP